MQARATKDARARTSSVRAHSPGGPPASAVRLLLSLQRQAGNSAVADFLGDRDGPGIALQRAPHGLRRNRTTGNAAAAERAEARDIELYDATRQRHDRNRATVQGWLNAGAAQHHDTRLRDSCEWANAGRAKISVLTKVHDSKARATAEGHPRGAAWFSYPAGDLSSAVAYYTRRVGRTGAWDNTNVEFEDVATVDGFSDSDTHTIALMETAIAKGPDYFYRVLEHEVQHAADDHDSSDLDDYKTEFRAYWLGSGEYDSVSPRARVQHLGWDWNARQWAIFWHLYNSAAYAHFKTAWDAENTIDDHALRVFQKAVVDFAHPESINPDNSIRVDTIYQALKATTHADCAADSTAHPNDKVTALRDALRALEAGERAQIRANHLYEPLLTTHLDGAVLIEIRRALAR
jgi:hypothetical protein